LKKKKKLTKALYLYGLPPKNPWALSNYGTKEKTEQKLQGWQHGSSGRAPDLQGQGPEFRPQYRKGGREEGRKGGREGGREKERGREEKETSDKTS
jgi:hypothetical protein